MRGEIIPRKKQIVQTNNIDVDYESLIKLVFKLKNFILTLKNKITEKDNKVFTYLEKVNNTIHKVLEEIEIIKVGVSTTPTNASGNNLEVKLKSYEERLNKLEEIINIKIKDLNDKLVEINKSTSNNNEAIHSLRIDMQSFSNIHDVANRYNDLNDKIEHLTRAIEEIKTEKHKCENAMKSEIYKNKEELKDSISKLSLKIASVGATISFIISILFKYVLK